jgi:hypothetical protein
MHRTLYLVGVGYLAICGMVYVGFRESRGNPVAPDKPATTVPTSGSGEAWYAAIKPYCNAVEVEIAQRDHPAPATLDGKGFSAACYALGGKIDSARAVIDRLPSDDRYKAAGIVFTVAHPVADAGDNRSAGPIMELVVAYWPNHYMALYHAGMAEYGLGQSELARQHLESFLRYYHQQDGWTRTARETLARLE